MPSFFLGLVKKLDSPLNLTYVKFKGAFTICQGFFQKIISIFYILLFENNLKKRLFLLLTRV